MTWSNYGKDGWELDHIKPLSSFDLVDPDQFKDACHYTNLAPVWRAHNRAKSNMPIGRRPNRIPLIILTGQSGAGKTWVASQLDQLYQHLSYDKIPKEQHYHYLIEHSFNGKPILYDPLRNAVSIYRRYRSLFDVQLVLIHEDVETVKSRIIKRGGKAIANVETFNKKFGKLKSKANFFGTSTEVLDYLKNGTISTPKEVPQPKPVVYLVSGVSGAGKSWVCEQLLDKFSYVSYDRNSKSKHLDLLKQPSDKPKLYDPPIKISTFIRRHSDIFDIHPIFIIEDEATIKARLAQRGGVFTDSAIKRIAAIESRNKKYGVFSGTSSEVLVYLQNTVV
jgi:broad-specificity NMP kinase